MSDTLIRVAKDGAHISVHPTCLAAHQAAGWTEAADQTPADTDLGLADSDEAPTGYRAMTVAELRALAGERSVDLADLTKKADIIAALELAAEEAAAAAE